MNTNQNNKKQSAVSGCALQKNDYVEVIIDDMGYMGEGIAHYNGASIFIKKAVKGEKIRAKIILVKPAFLIGIIDKILMPSPLRVTPPCPYYNKCGGCGSQHIDYHAQVNFKLSALKTTLAKQLINLPALEECVKSENIYNYRNKLSLPVRENVLNPKELDIGFFAANSHKTVNIENCLLQSFDCKKLIETVRGFAKENSLKGYNENSGGGDIRHVVCREISGVLIIAIVVTHPLKAQLKALNDKLKVVYNNSYSLYANYNKNFNNIIFSDSFEFIGGNNTEIVYDGIKISLHPAAFFQVNNYIKNRLYERVISEVSLGKNIIIDAYSGAGLLSGMLSKSADTVYALEINKEAHSSALSMIKQNHFNNIKPILGDCKDTLPALIDTLKTSSAESDFANNVAVIFDPPRAGLDEKVISAVLNNPVNKIVYISCSPATLARDLKLLEKGYTVKTVAPFDMFPQTPNLETLTVLERSI